MKIHTLKTWPLFWDSVEGGTKLFEVRENDRDFKAGDVLILRKFDPHSQQYPLNKEGVPFDMMFRVSFILHGGQLGIADGFCVMSLEPMP